MSQLTRLLLAALAVYRLARLLTSEAGPLQVFQRGRRALGRWAAARNYNRADVLSLSAAELVNCPYCLGVWLAAGCVPLVLRPTPGGDAVLLWLGLAGAQAWLQGRH